MLDTLRNQDKMVSRNTVKSILAGGLVACSAVLPIGSVSDATAAGGLCAVNSEYADQDWITSIQLGNASLITGEQGVTYKDGTATAVGNFTAGSTGNQITVSVQVDMANSDPGDIWPEDVFIWVDLNQDGVVDLNTEQIFADSETTDNFTVPDSNIPTSKTHTFTGTFSIPSTAYNGVAIGRAMLQYVNQGDQPFMCNSDPDGWDPGVSAFEAGTVIDFKLGITGGVDKPNLANTGSTDGALAIIGGGLFALGAAIYGISRRRRKVL